jgi:hypothetical protein
MLIRFVKLCKVLTNLSTHLKQSKSDHFLIIRIFKQRISNVLILGSKSFLTQYELNEKRLHLFEMQAFTY